MIISFIEYSADCFVDLSIIIFSCLVLSNQPKVIQFMTFMTKKKNQMRTFEELKATTVCPFLQEKLQE